MNTLAALRQLIIDTAFVRNTEEQIDTRQDPEAWLFDFRRILMNGRGADLIADLFFDRYKYRYPFQLCTLEVAGVPLVTSLMNKFYARGHEDINAFFIRKSRKKDWLMRMIEGQVQDTQKIILVDDIMNSGNSFWRQIEVLDELGYKVDTVWSIIRFRDPAFYTRFYNRGIKVESLFELNDFTEYLGERVRNLNTIPQSKYAPMVFQPRWIFRSDNPSLSYVVPKSQPVLDGELIYFGTDNQNFWAINQTNGEVVWKFRVGLHAKGKSIFSNPALYKNTVIFGAYDGNLYCLNKHTGVPEWINIEADWVGSSPAVAPELEMVFVGVELGTLRRRGGIIALDANSGATVWSDLTHGGFTHSSPLYLPEHQEVIIGSNDGRVRLYDARNGTLKWIFGTHGGMQDTSFVHRGFGKGDIKESFAYSQKHDYIAFGAIDGYFYVLERSTGHLVTSVKCEYALYATPLIYKDRVYFAATDKRLRVLDLNTLQLIATENLDNTRIFSAPTVINGRLYVGTNAGRLHELDPSTLQRTGYYQARERITNSVVYNPATDTFFLPTYANEIIALQREGDSASNVNRAGLENSIP